VARRWGEVQRLRRWMQPDKQEQRRQDSPLGMVGLFLLARLAAAAAHLFMVMEGTGVEIIQMEQPDPVMVAVAAARVVALAMPEKGAMALCWLLGNSIKKQGGIK
jgi:hypothetical protein